MSDLSEMSLEFRAEKMRNRMVVKICADGRPRNTLRKLTREEKIESFWSMVDKNGSVPLHCPEIGKCWIWLGAKCGSERKYGSFSFNGTTTKAHRVAYEISVGPIPKGLLGCHKCDNRLCVNPDHIFPGTQKDNAQDMIKKGRKVVGVSRGEANPLSKIKTHQVLKVKEMWDSAKFTRKQISEATGVGFSNVASITEGRSWRHVTGYL